MSGRQLRIPTTPKRPRMDSSHCGRVTCLCTHTHPCDRGWLAAPDRVNTDTGMVYEQVAGCPVCHPDAADRIARNLERTSRNA